MALSCPDVMLGAMKIIASVAALVLMGLLAGWLWLDATADVRGDTAGVAISGSVDPAALTGGVLSPTPSDDDATTDDVAITGTPAATDAAEDGLAAGVVSVLRASAGELVDRAEETRAAEKKAMEEAEAKEKAKQEAQEKENKPVEVQPAPVNPGGWCEWDDDDGWECDAYDDDEHDDDWDDD
ncbi:MAG: hypothetical protein DCC50_14830 [Acidobacteria bacterium]|nr:MAG: hypothetical protein DCC50_14830 [Acidobacteriota bacterium]